MKAAAYRVFTYKRVALVLTVLILELALWTVSKNPASVVTVFALLFLWQFVVATPKNIWEREEA